MCKLWTNFAKYGDPTPKHSNPLPIKWKSVDQVSSENDEEIHFNYLIIDDEPQLVQNINKHRIDFWRNVYRKWNKSFIVSKL